jgi:AbrB family looped-hinge helix DNA binding protein
MVGIKIGAKVGAKGQVVIPKPIREQFHINSDTELIFDVEKEKITLQKKKSGLDILADFVNAAKSKKKFPENADWDKDHYSQFE